jgi:hypothetical protein
MKENVIDHDYEDTYYRVEITVAAIDLPKLINKFMAPGPDGVPAMLEKCARLSFSEGEDD